EGSYPERGRKTVVLLDAAKLLGKLHFSLWRRCHNSFLPKSCTISTSRSVRRRFSTACSCVAIPRTSCGGTSKSPRWSSRSGTAKRNATRSFAIFSRAWWITGVTSWPSSIPISVPTVFAQQVQDANAPPAPQKLDKETKRKMRRTLKELDSAYRQWLTEDVTYIISPDERNAFLQLDTNEEREQFIEQFWLRRSSNPDLPENDFKEEHYRRIAYANEHYASGIPGWKTDRGRMYIMWGPADEVE